MNEKMYTVAELEEMLQKMKPKCEVCHITEEIITPAILKGGAEGFYELYYGVDAEIDPIRSRIKYCPACGRRI